MRASLTALLIAVSLGLAACGSSDDDGGSSAGDGAGEAQAAGETAPAKTAAIDPAYDGPDKRFFKTLPTPERKSGQRFEVGFLEANGAEVTHDIWIEGTREQVRALGGELIVKDAQLDAAKQASQLQELLAQDVDAIVAVPLVAQVLRPGLDGARAKGIPVVGLAASFDLSEPTIPGYDVSVGPGWDYAAFSVAKALADQRPGAGVALLGLGAPIPALQYELARERHWAAELGLRPQGQVDARSPSDPAGIGAAAATLLSKYPDAKVVMTFNDTAAIAAASAARRQGVSDVAFGDALGGNPVVKPAIESGAVAAVYAFPWERMGQQAAVAAYALVSEQDLPLPKLVNVPSVVLTKENVGSYDFGE